MNSHYKYFKKELGKLPIEELWKIIEKLSIGHKIPDKTMIDYEQVLELCVILKVADEKFRNLEQIAILKKELNK
ncbi:MAG: hypothetical protein KGI28_08415 [Thaumarchaeota archaeon]|nr:hypothetical protein [Nitrososphaerota archaeon]